MDKFSFDRQNPEDKGDLGEKEGDIRVPDDLDEEEEKAGTTRRILILAGIGAILIGGWYLADRLFLTPAPAPPPVARPAIPAPPMKAPEPRAPAPVKEPASVPEATTKPPAKEGKKPSEGMGGPGMAAPLEPGKELPKAPAGLARPKGKVDTKATVSPEKAPVVSRAESKPPARPLPIPPAGYSLQLGAMVLEENAEVLKRRLDSSGFPAVIRKATAFVTKHVVTVGEPAGRSEAEDLSRRLNVDGFPSQLLPVEGKYTPQVGAYFNLDEAIDLARELQKRNYSPKISSQPANTPVFQVRHGKFETRVGAVKRGEELKAKGFNFLVVHE